MHALPVPEMMLGKILQMDACYTRAPFCRPIASAKRLVLQANMAIEEEEYARKHAGAVAGQEGRRVWGPKPPPQHAARLCAELVLAAVGQADGRTLVAQVCTTLTAPVAFPCLKDPLCMSLDSKWCSVGTSTCKSFLLQPSGVGKMPAIYCACDVVIYCAADQ